MGFQQLMFGITIRWKELKEKDYLLVDCMSGYIFVEQKFAIFQKIKTLELLNFEIYLWCLYDYSLYSHKYIHKGFVFNEYPLLLHGKIYGKICLYSLLITHTHRELRLFFTSCIFLLIYSVSQRYLWFYWYDIW